MTDFNHFVVSFERVYVLFLRSVANIYDNSLPTEITSNFSLMKMHLDTMDAMFRLNAPSDPDAVYAYTQILDVCRTMYHCATL